MNNNESSVAEQVKRFTVEAAAVLTAAAPAFLIIVILVAAVSAAYIEYLFHSAIIGEYAVVTGGSYGAFRFAVGGAGIQMSKVNRWIPAFLFVFISFLFTAWSTWHVDYAVSVLKIGGSDEAAEMILLTVLWTAFAGELVLGIFSFVMERSEEGNWGN